MSVVWLNGRLVDPGDAVVAVGDRGFTLGDGLFETLRAYGGRVFRLDAHLSRLRSGADRIGLALPEDLEAGVHETVAGAEEGELAVRVTASRGVGGQGLAGPREPVPTVVVTAHPYRAEPRWYEAGITAGIASGRLDEGRATAGLKHLGYLEAVLAVERARVAGHDDALFLDGAGHLAEGASSNLFVVIGGALRTPPLSCGVLPGITRAAVLELAEASGLAVSEAPFEPALLEEADEAFLTSSLREIVPLVAVEGRQVGAGAPGPVTRRLLASYRELARGRANTGGRRA